MTDDQVRDAVAFMVKQVEGGGVAQAETPAPSKRTVRARKAKNNLGVVVQGMGDLLVRFGKCCNPIHGDSIKGFITRGRGVTVHVRDCSFLKSADPERIIDAQWDERSHHVAVVPVEVICEDKKPLCIIVQTANRKDPFIYFF